MRIGNKCTWWMKESQQCEIWTQVNSVSTLPVIPHPRFWCIPAQCAIARILYHCLIALFWLRKLIGACFISQKSQGFYTVPEQWLVVHSVYTLGRSTSTWNTFYDVNFKTAPSISLTNVSPCYPEWPLTW